MLTLHTTQAPQVEASRALNTHLAQAQNRDVLLLLSGGSALALVETIDLSLLSSRTTIGMVDERHTHDETHSNFAQLTALPMWEDITGRGVTTLDSRPRAPESLEDTEHRLNIALMYWHITHHDGVVIATLGVGADGHTAGILPYPEDPTLFRSLFEQRHRCIRGYRVSPDKNPHTQRITTTIAYLTRHVDHAVVLMTGQEKKVALEATMRADGSFAHTPARVLHTLRDAHLFTNLTAPLDRTTQATQ